MGNLNQSFTDTGSTVHDNPRWLANVINKMGIPNLKNWIGNR
jgi:hypothetical protein